MVYSQYSFILKVFFVYLVQDQMLNKLWVSVEILFTNYVTQVVTIERRSTYYLIFDYNLVLR